MKAPLRLVDWEAATVILQIDKDTADAVLLFSGVTNAPLAVTIPLSQVQRLHDEISQLIAQDSFLFSRGPNRRGQR